MTLEMADNNIVTIISESRNLRALPFRPTENQLSVGKEWEEWLDAIEREFRYFRINSPADRKDALIIYGGTEIARLEKTLPDNDPDGNLDDYQKVKQKLNDYFQPKRNKHHARYIFLKSRPEAGETIVAYATRLREKAQGCDFGSSNDDRILEHLIQTIEEQYLIQKCIYEGWTLDQFLTQAKQIEDISVQVDDMKTDQLSKKISKVEEHRREWTQSQNYIQFRTQPCSYCGLTGVHPRGRNCPAYGVQCEICRKYNHFTSVCREKRKWIEPIDEAMRPPHCYTRMKRKEGVNKANVIHHSSQSLDDSSVAHVRIKTVKQSLPQENEDSRQIKELQEGISRLQKDLDSAKNLIQQILVQQRMTVVGLDEAINEKERFMESYDLSRNTDMKRTYLTSKKINMGTTERIEGCVHNNKMNVKNEERMTRSNRTGRRSRSKRKHMRPCLLDKAIHSDYLFNLSN